MILVHPDKYLKDGLQLSNWIFALFAVFVAFSFASLFVDASTARLLALIASMSASMGFLCLSYYIQLRTHDRLEIMSLMAELNSLNKSRGDGT